MANSWFNCFWGVKPWLIHGFNYVFGGKTMVNSWFNYVFGGKTMVKSALCSNTEVICVTLEYKSNH